jgi:5-methylcytosine-specific restriction endonuclease McrA
MPYKDKTSELAIKYKISAAQRVKNWRADTKHKAMKALGGCCQICGYDKHYSALDLHHLEPDKKEFNLSKVLVRPMAAKKIVDELEKCVLLCSNCHRELHAGATVLPGAYAIFDREVFLTKLPRR